HRGRRARPGDRPLGGFLRARAGRSPRVRRPGRSCCRVIRTVVFPKRKLPSAGILARHAKQERPMSEDVQQTVFGIIAKEANIDVSKITLDSTLKDLQIASLDAIQIIFEIEDHYKIQMPDRDPNFDTESVRGLVETVRKLLAEQTTNPPPAAPPPSPPASG